MKAVENAECCVFRHKFVKMFKNVFVVQTNISIFVT